LGGRAIRTPGMLLRRHLLSWKSRVSCLRRVSWDRELARSDFQLLRQDGCTTWSLGSWRGTVTIRKPNAPWSRHSQVTTRWKVTPALLSLLTDICNVATTVITQTSKISPKPTPKPARLASTRSNRQPSHCFKPRLTSLTCSTILRASSSC